MHSYFSLTLGVVDKIDQQQRLPRQRRIDSLKQEVISRLLGLSLSILGAVDCIGHLSLAAAYGIYTLYARVVKKEQANFKLAWEQVAIALLFRRALFSGSLVGVVNPKGATHILDNEEMTVVASLLFHGNSKVAENCCVRPLYVLKVMQTVIATLPVAIQQEMQSSLKLLDSAYTLEENDRLDFLVSILMRENKHSLLGQLLAMFDCLEQVQGSLMKRVLLKHVMARVLSLIIPIFTALSVIAILCRLTFDTAIVMLCTLALGFYASRGFGGHYMGSRTSIKLKLIDLTRSLIGIIAWPTLGLVHPFWVKKRVFFPLSNLHSCTLKKLLKDIKNLTQNSSVLFPIGMPTANPLKECPGHMVYCLLTKETQGYRVSIVNRGWGSEWHDKTTSDGAKAEVDYSWSQVDFQALQGWLPLLVNLRHRLKAYKMYRIFTKALKKRKIYLDKDFDLFNAFLYNVLPKITPNKKYMRWSSGHICTTQRVGLCPLSGLLGALSLHSSMQNKDSNLQASKRSYKRFIYHCKRKLLEDKGYLLPFYRTLNGERKNLPLLAAAQIKKAKEKFIARYPDAIL